jgi:hypothetical protein
LDRLGMEGDLSEGGILCFLTTAFESSVTSERINETFRALLPGQPPAILSCQCLGRLVGFPDLEGYIVNLYVTYSEV